MDNITHALTGLAIARAGLNQFCPHATLLLIISANAPDIDILGLSGGELRYLEVHRGYTHSLLCLPVMALLTVLVVAGIHRRSLPWTRAWFLCCLGVASHLLLDWTNSYGTRLLLPFSSRWCYLDINSLCDGYILAALAFAALWPLFSRLVSNEIGDRTPTGRGVAVFALTFLVLFDAARLVFHERAVAQMESRLYLGVPAIRTAALPEALTPLRWTGIIETAAAYRVTAVSDFAEFEPGAAHVFYKPAPGPALENAKRTQPFQYFAYFARFPLWSETPISVAGATGLRIDLTDARFGRPGAGSFHCITVEDSRYRVLRSWFTFGSGSDVGSERSADFKRRPTAGSWHHQ